MGATDTPADIDALLVKFDAADRAVRELYLALADDPDRAAEVETSLKELQWKRGELAHRVGLGALARWRDTKNASQDASSEDEASAALVADARTDDDSATAGAPTDETTEPDASPPPPNLQPTPQPSDPTPQAPAERVSTADLEKFKSDVAAHGLGQLRTHTSLNTPWEAMLHEMMGTLGEPRDLNDTVAFIDELDAFEATATSDEQARWTRLPRDVQQTWLSLLVARTRAMRDHPNSGRVRERLRDVRAVFPLWTREHVPGHVHGLQLRHEPHHGSWAADALDYWNALRSRVGEELPRREQGSPKKRARPIRAEEEAETLEPESPLVTIVRGKTVLMVGGEAREPNRERIEAYFGFGSLEWPSIDGPRKVEAVARRIEKRAYDLVVVLTGLIAHKESGPVVDAAKASGVLWAMADGYGVASIRQGLERFLQDVH